MKMSKSDINCKLNKSKSNLKPKFDKSDNNINNFREIKIIKAKSLRECTKNKERIRIKPTKFLLMILLFQSILLCNENGDSNIILKIKGTGNIKIYNKIDKSNIESIFINGERVEEINSSDFYYNFVFPNNTIKINLKGEIKTAEEMFYTCENIYEMDFSNFDTSQITDMTRMLRDCSSLESINLSNFVTSNLEVMSYMFSGCSSLKSLDLSNFNTSKVVKMNSVFRNLTSLKSIDLSNFDTSNVVYLQCLFLGCTSLISINISNFDTSETSQIQHMFRDCLSITSLDLSHFKTNKVTNIGNMFDGCSSLEYLNIENFIQPSSYTDIFNGVPDNIVICLSNTENAILNKLPNKECTLFSCSDDWKSNKKKILENNGNCIDDCMSDNIYKYEYNDKCISEFPNGYLINNSTHKMCKCELDECLLCPSVALKNNLCLKCNEGYYPKENDPLNIGDYFKCYNETEENYYFDDIAHLFKKCYYRCKKCEINGNDEYHNCLICNDIYNFEIQLTNTNYKNCYIKCNYYYYFDENNNYHCTYNNSCPDNYKFIPEKLECIIDCAKDNVYIYEYKKICYDHIIKEMIINTENENNTNTNTKEYTKKYAENLENIFTSGIYNTDNLDKGQDDTFTSGKTKFTFTTTNNQRNKNNNGEIRNETIIDLGGCETLLRWSYNMTENDTLYMLKIDTDQDEMKTPKINYEIYAKLNESDSNLVKLDKSICSDIPITLLIPVALTESLDKLNASSDYYNDICYTTTSDSGTDMSLNDRKISYIQDKKAICQEDCIFSEYNDSTITASCSCNITETESIGDNMDIDTMKLYKVFVNPDEIGEGNIIDAIEKQKNIHNLGITSCNILNSKENIVKNTGFYILLIILAIFVIVFIIFCSKGYKSLEMKIDAIIAKNFGDETIRKPNKMQTQRNKNLDYNKKTNLKRKPLTKFKKKEDNSNILKIKGNDSRNSMIKKNNKKIKNNNLSKLSRSKKKLPSNPIRNKINNNKKNDPSKPITDYEFNWLTYDLALKFDKRKNCSYYCSLIRGKQIFIFTFCSFNDYNSGIIKKFIFFYHSLYIMV